MIVPLSFHKEELKEDRKKSRKTKEHSGEKI